MNPQDTLNTVLSSYEIQLPPAQVAQLQAYCEQLWDWNRKLNLTRHTDYQKFVTRDLADCLQLSALLEDDAEVLDVGSGGGVPGVVLAILRPGLQMSLCESVRKRAAALQSIVDSLALPTPVHHARAEDLLEDLRFDVLVVRAVGPLWKLLKWFQPHWHCIGRLLVVKGPRWVEERAEARHRGYLRPLELRRVATYLTPGSQIENAILQIWPADASGVDA
jgi:16S rRNA (guanine527-N7)-methyltransferase